MNMLIAHGCIIVKCVCMWSYSRAVFVCYCWQSVVLYCAVGQVAPLEVVAERISESTLALVAVVVVMLIIMVVLVGVIFFVRW